MKCFILSLNVYFYMDFFYIGVAYHLTTIGGISNSLSSYGVKNLHRSFVLSIKSTSFIWMVQSDFLKWTGKTLKEIESFLVLFLKNGRKIPAE